MRNIKKGSEPKSLTEHRSMRYKEDNHKPNYGTYTQTDDLRDSLIREQRGLCCYCMSRITPETVKIEHWHSQTRYPAETLNYRNLLGACPGGGDHRPLEEQHCDTRKGDLDLSRNPADPSPNVEALIEYQDNGKIYSRNAEFNDELNGVLNLNAKFLLNNREDALMGFLTSLPAKDRWDRQRLLRERARWNGETHNDHLKPYCQMVVCWINRRLQRS